MVVKTKYDYGVWFNGHHSTEFHLDVLEKEIGMPDKDKNTVPIPFTNLEYDYSEFYGSQNFKQREIKVVFKIQNWDSESKDGLYQKWTVAVNWLMKPNGLTPLIDDIMPQYQYRAEVQKAPDFNEARTKGTITVKFTAYPFRIDIMPEGHDLVTFINVDLDVRQYTTFEVNPGIESRNPDTFTYRQLNIGDKATYGAWTGHYVNDKDETGTPIPDSIRGFSDIITDKRQIQIWNRSRWAYKMKTNGLWLREQDIIEAYTEYEDEILVNNGTTEVVPEITLKRLGNGGNANMTIVKEGQIFNLKPGTYNSEMFTLKPGENHLRLYTRDGANINFNFHKELI